MTAVSAWAGSKSGDGSGSSSSDAEQIVGASRRPSKPQLSIGLRNFASTAPADWRHILDQARAADLAGVDRIFVPDHLAFGSDLTGYSKPGQGGVVGGVQPTEADGEWLDSLTILGAIAAVTDRVRLATNILVAPLRGAVVLAKVASTIDVISHGRFDLGVGIGWQKAEYRAVGVEFSERGRVLDETLAACRDLWTSREASYIAKDFSLDGIHMMPKPVRPDGVPVWIGGRPIPATARRLVRYGTGWIPWGVTSESFGEAAQEMRRLVEDEGGDFGTLQIALGLPTVVSASTGGLDLPAMFEPVPDLVQLGVSDFRTMVRIPHDAEAARSSFEDLLAEFERALPSGEKADEAL
ncbi:TIGR03619 family F420-dependent LLM class oxidoreductase [Jatrophihabitans sp. GAS493]|uniref:TIGR03619 family F420-dependent LLM class oxidoreductase n=1 Tax=Jatrophihabitans sp. GAS493 TaxID=1907575 RepID=UPI0012FE3DED|nr:TIGR03619 family F420-dependent LLM class oxidoreductase [Jatrophihabitans sp. GAS493]